MSDEADRDIGRVLLFRRTWVVVAAIGLAATFALIFGRNYGGWLTWLGDAFQGVYVTLTFYLVVLTYKLFKLASGASRDNERIQRTAQLPIVVCDLKPLAFVDGRPKFRLKIYNEGGGPAFDIRVAIDFRVKDLLSDGASSEETGTSLAVLRSKSKAKRTVDVTQLMLDKPWASIDLRDRDGFPGQAESTFLLGKYSLVMSVTYRDVYGSTGCTLYHASAATGDDIAPVRIQLPDVRANAGIKPVDMLSAPQGHVEPEAVTLDSAASC